MFALRICNRCCSASSRRSARTSSASQHHHKSLQPLRLYLRPTTLFSMAMFGTRVTDSRIVNASAGVLVVLQQRLQPF